MRARRAHLMDASLILAAMLGQIPLRSLSQPRPEPKPYDHEGAKRRADDAKAAAEAKRERRKARNRALQRAGED